MRGKRFIILGMVIVALIVLFYHLRYKKVATGDSLATAPTEPNPPQTIPGASAGTQSIPVPQNHRAAEIVQSIYTAPIAFFGKVQDQYGKPVPDAQIDYSVIDKYFEPASKKSGVADKNGNFSLTGVQGAALTVGVSKEGYDPIYQQSNGAFSFGVPNDSQRDRPTPTQENPAMFVLRKKASAEPLVAIDRDVLVPKDGRPVEVSLKTGKAVGAARGDIKIECWTSDQTKDAQGRYEWRYRLSVPGGGVTKRQDPELNFQAPEDGYQPNLESHMLPTSPRWRPDDDGQYWVKLADGTFARMRFRITTGGGHFASIISYLNPTPGDRNLEFDPKNQIKPK